MPSDARYHSHIVPTMAISHTTKKGSVIKIELCAPHHDTFAGTILISDANTGSLVSLIQMDDLVDWVNEHIGQPI